MIQKLKQNRQTGMKYIFVFTTLIVLIISGLYLEATAKPAKYCE